MSSVALGAAVISSLIGTGVTDVVLAPGSRSAPLALAAEQADREGKLRLHVRVDERVAGFTALGLAKASGRAVAVVTTSGTAVANLAPAAMEARAAGVPLVALTADRPAYLVGTGANQTGDQVGVFGPAAVGVIRLSSESGDIAAWAAGIHRGVALAEGHRTRRPGPVQINLEFAPPLVGPLPALQALGVQITRSRGTELRQLDSRPTVVLAGDASPEVGAEARAAAEVAGAPLLAEPSSNARAGRHAIPDYYTGLEQLGPQIRRVVCFGHPTLSREVALLLSRPDIELVIVAEGADWPDAGHRAAIVTDRVILEEQPAGWLKSWHSIATLPAPEGFTARFVVDETIASLTSADNLVLGASGVIRAADRSPISAHPPRVFANRGLAGIDGVIATATGIGLATGRSTTVLLGDLTAQHDLGSFVRPPLEPGSPLRVIVVDDGGGTIFGSLEQGAQEYAHAFERVFLTPQQVDLAAVAASLGWQTAVVTDARGLRSALTAGIELIVARVEMPRLGHH